MFFKWWTSIAPKRQYLRPDTKNGLLFLADKTATTIVVDVPRADFDIDYGTLEIIKDG